MSNPVIKIVFNDDTPIQWVELFEEITRLKLEYVGLTAATFVYEDEENDDEEGLE